MFDQFLEWGPAKNRPSDQQQLEQQQQQTLDQRDASGERPDDN